MLLQVGEVNEAVHLLNILLDENSYALDGNGIVTPGRISRLKIDSLVRSKELPPEMKANFIEKFPMISKTYGVKVFTPTHRGVRHI